MDKEQLTEAFKEFLNKHFSGTTEETKPSVEVTKSVDEESKQALFVALPAMPDDNSEADLHGDTYSAEEVEKACHSYNKHCMKTNLEHLVMVDDDMCYVVESYVTPVDMQIGDTFVTKGSWLQKWQFQDGSLWQGVKEGYWEGISIQCMADVEELDNED